MTRTARALLTGVVLAAGRSGADTWNSERLVSEAERHEEVRVKDQRVLALLKERDAEALILTKSRNQSWLLGGSDLRIVHAQQESPVWLLVRRDGAHRLLANNIEAARLMREEGLASLGYAERRHPWFERPSDGTDPRWRLARAEIPSGRMACDAPLADTLPVATDLARIRFPLIGPETRRYRWLGRRTAEAVVAVCRGLTAGLKETDVATRITAELDRRGLHPTVVLIGSDERLEDFRHLTPTDVTADRVVLVNVCAEKWGLVVAMSRLVHFGEVSASLRGRMEACGSVDAAYLRAARPGATFGEIFAKGAAAYARAGYPEQWRHHHQGGSIGYFEREALIGPEATDAVVEGMALALNPTLPGVKVEDTVLIGPRGAEILTETPGWPTMRVSADGLAYDRPGFLVLPARTASSRPRT